jgi:hypothetical protein
MKASVVDLRYRMKQVLKALDRREQVTLLYHGKVKGTIVPVAEEQISSVAEHPFFNMSGKEVLTVNDQMDELRKTRFDDV